MDIQITIAEKSEQPILENLMQLYLYDFSEMCGDDCRRTGPVRMTIPATYWIEPPASFFDQGGRQAGGLCTGPARTEAPEDPPPHSIAEFFIMRKYRRQGVGEQAAFQIFDRFPGPWHVAKSRKCWRDPFLAPGNRYLHRRQL
jgi:predicted acetyltransferase